MAKDKANVSLDENVRRHSSLIKAENGVSFRDLNKNGKLDIYEDPRQPLETRVDDLLSQMTLAEKAGMMFINGAVVNTDGSLEEQPGAAGFGRVAKTQLLDQKMTHFNLWQIPGVQAVAVWHNNLQKLAEESRLGIPVTIASDPRNHFSNAIFAMAAAEFSQWCETLGFGAIGDAELVRQFANIVRQEYLAVGIRVALHPQIDLATEPRWARISGTFGEDAELTAALGAAYIRGLQGERLGPHSVACMTKHFPGGGPQKEGLDPHFEFQKGQVYPGNNFDYHLIPFEAALAANTASIMPYYGVPMNQTDENVAMSFNKAIITGLLREKYGYDGVVCTDWGLITDLELEGFVWPARAWGVEHLSEAERVKKAIDAGVDQFGGESRPELVVQREVRFACHGGCPKNRFIHTPDGELGLNYLCAGYKAFFNHVDRPMKIMARLLRQHRPPAEIMAIIAAEDEEQQRQAYAQAGRNDPCPCGSGKKFKQCHGR